jgi:hypothetical protein
MRRNIQENSNLAVQIFQNTFFQIQYAAFLLNSTYFRDKYFWQMGL